MRTMERNDSPPEVPGPGEPTSVDAASAANSAPGQSWTADRENLTKYLKIFHGSSSLLALTDFRTGKILEVNDTWVRVTGIPALQAQGRTALELGLWADPSAREVFRARVRTVEKVTDQESFLVLKGRITPVLLSVSNLRVGSEPCLIWSFRDLTELKKAEAAFEHKLRQAAPPLNTGVASAGLSRRLDLNGPDALAGASRRIGELQVALATGASALRATQAELRALREAIPFCRHCKRIRTEGSAWIGLERFLAEHPEATFSHGVCPECYLNGARPTPEGLTSAINQGLRNPPG